LAGAGKDQHEENHDEDHEGGAYAQPDQYQHVRLKPEDSAGG
jgi:hypothetical protein